MAKADLVFYLLPFLMLNLIIGTLAQHFIGLYESHKIFFAAPFYFAGPVPLPGSYTLLTILTFGILVKFLLHSEWRWNKAGVILTHLGTLILLMGGIVTALTAREGFMAIAENEATPYIYDYNNRELFIFENDVLLHRLEFKNLHGKIALPNFPFLLDIVQTCRNCEITAQDNKNFKKGMAQFMQLSPKALEKQDETNLSGATFEISGASENQNGIYIAFENMPKPIALEKNKHNYKIMFGKEQRLLPFNVRLENFTKQNYTGTDNAQNYMSDVIIEDQGVKWPARIEMNKPLHYKGYTFYQSSFEQGPKGETALLTVVENQGRLFPYIATGLIACGLLMHLALHMRRKA